MKDSGLNNKLHEYTNSDYLPMHMPGHKRNPDFITQEFMSDITEIDGFDNFHNPEGLILDINKKFSHIYGADNSYISVNGSTGLIIASILAVSTNNKKKAIVSSNCHISVLRGLEISGVEPVFVSPAINSQTLSYGAIDPSKIEFELENRDDISFVIITSPTYEGIISDIPKIYEITQRYDVPLIVDEAHGAHLGLSEYFPSNTKADIVIKSLHKTLNSPTSTAVMLTYNSDSTNISDDMIRHYISLVTTTSPSYILMSGMDKCADTLINDKKLIDCWGANILKLRNSLQSSLKNLSLYEPQNSQYDNSKIVILTNGFISGYELSNKLRNEYHIEVEASFQTHIIAMTGIGDTDESLERFKRALLDIDSSILNDYRSLEPENNINPIKVYEDKQIEFLLPMGEAIKSRSELIDIGSSNGRISTEYIFSYPPGVPIVFPGMRISDREINMISELKIQGASIITDPRRNYSDLIRVKVDITND